MKSDETANLYGINLGQFTFYVIVKPIGNSQRDFEISDFAVKHVTVPADRGVPPYRRTKHLMAHLYIWLHWAFLATPEF